jgi:hypothetical protein
MANDIVTRLNTEEMTKAFYKAFPRVVTLEDVMRQALEGSDEIEILRDKCKHLEAELARFERLSNG